MYQIIILGFYSSIKSLRTHPTTLIFIMAMNCAPSRQGSFVVVDYSIIVEIINNYYFNWSVAMVTIIISIIVAGFVVISVINIIIKVIVVIEVIAIIENIEACYIRNLMKLFVSYSYAKLAIVDITLKVYSTNR